MYEQKWVWNCVQEGVFLQMIKCLELAIKCIRSQECERGEREKERIDRWF